MSSPCSLTETKEWQETCSRYGWEAAFQGHEEFEQFLDETNGEYRELLDEIGVLAED